MQKATLGTSGRWLRASSFRGILFWCGEGSAFVVWELPSLAFCLGAAFSYPPPVFHWRSFSLQRGRELHFGAKFMMKKMGCNAVDSAPNYSREQMLHDVPCTHAPSFAVCPVSNQTNDLATHVVFQATHETVSPWLRCNSMQCPVSISIQSKFKHILFKIGVTVATTYLFSTYTFLLLLWSGFMSEADLHDSLAKNQAICCHPSENIKGSHKFMPLAIVLNFFSVSSFLLSSSFQGAAALE